MHAHALCIRKETPFKNLITDRTLLVDKTVVSTSSKVSKELKGKRLFKRVTRRCIWSGVSELTHMRGKAPKKVCSIVTWDTRIINVLVVKMKLPNGRQYQVEFVSVYTFTLIHQQKAFKSPFSVWAVAAYHTCTVKKISFFFLFLLFVQFLKKRKIEWKKQLGYGKMS